MTDATGAPDEGPQPEEGQEAPRSGPVIRDKRRVDPETGELRNPGGAPAADRETGQDPAAGEGGAAGESVSAEAEPHPDTLLAEQRLGEMQRMQAEFVNFRNRTQREREADKARAVGTVVEAMLPVLDDVHSAREHGDLDDGPLAAIVDKMETTLAKFGVERVGYVGDVFDPVVHEALMHLGADSPGVEIPEGATEMTVVQVMQPGFRVGDQLVRPARVAVADPV